MDLWVYIGLTIYWFKFKTFGYFESLNTYVILFYHKIQFILSPLTVSFSNVKNFLEIYLRSKAEKAWQSPVYANLLLKFVKRISLLMSQNVSMLYSAYIRKYRICGINNHPSLSSRMEHCTHQFTLHLANLDLGMGPYKVQLVQELKAHDH